MSTPVLEIVEYQTQSEITENDFLAIVEQSTQALKAYDGFVNRTTARREDGTWVDVVEWRDMAAALAGFDSFVADEAAQAFLGATIEESTRMFHYEIKSTDRP